MTAEDMPEYSNWLIIATTIFLVWALMFAGVRVWAKVTRNLSWSAGDSIFAGAFVCLQVMSTFAHADSCSILQSLGVAQCTCVYLAISFGFEREDATPSTSDALSYKKVSAANVGLQHRLRVFCRRCSQATSSMSCALVCPNAQLRSSLEISQGVWSNKDQHWQ